MVAPGEGRSIFGPPVDPFLPAMLSSEENGESGPRCQLGSPSSVRSEPTLFSPFIDMADLSHQHGPCHA